MYAFIKEGVGKYYTSMVFGYYDTSTNSMDYKHLYWVVLNKEKTALVNQPIYQPGRSLQSMVLIVDADQSNWNSINENTESVDFLPTRDLYKIVEEGTIPKQLLDKCIFMDREYVLEPYPAVKSAKDNKNIDWVTGGFHDGRIVELKEEGDSVYLLFDDLWGCKLEIWFEGDVSYDASSRDPKEDNPYWQDGTVVIQDGYVYLIDDENATIDDIGEGLCWFKAREMKYHVIPK